MAWGAAELEPEVEKWLEALTDEQFGHAAFYVDLLEEQGPLLSEPYTRQLDGKLRELRFYMGREQTRISYYIATGRRIVLLTVFRKERQRETAEVTRASKAMRRCIDQGHTADD
jgi:hypothetical protein